MTQAGRSAPDGQRGMGLVEVMVVGVVIGLLLMTIDRVFTSVHVTSRKAQLAADVQQNVRSAVTRLARELRESRASMLACHPDPGCPAGSAQVAFPSARPSDAASVFCIDVAASDGAESALLAACTTPIPLTGTYTPVWQRYVGYHRNAEGELRRLVQAAPIPLPMAPDSGQVVATSVVAFGIGRSDRIVRLVLSARGREQVQGGPLPAQEMTLEDVIDLRNCVDETAG